MSYEKNTWKTGDIVTSEKLNHIEQGIETAASGGSESENEFIVYATQRVGQYDYTTDHTGNDILNYLSTGKRNVKIILKSSMDTVFQLVDYYMDSQTGEMVVAVFVGFRYSTAATTPYDPASFKVSLAHVYPNDDYQIKIGEFKNLTIAS